MFININRPEFKCLQIIPDRTVRDGNSQDFARNMYEVRTPIRKRINIKNRKIHYCIGDTIMYQLFLSKDIIQFYFTIPKIWEDYIKDKINAEWPKATVLENKISNYLSDKINYLTFINHDFFAIHTTRNDYRPLSALFEVAKGMKDGDKAIIDITFSPIDRKLWEHDAEECYAKYRRGEPLDRTELTAKSIGKSVLRASDSILEELHEFFTFFLSMEEKKVSTNKFDQIYDKKFSRLMLKNKQGLTESTIRKIREPVFRTTIKINTCGQRSAIIARSIAGAYNDLASTDQEFELSKSKSSFIVCASELGKLVQLPGPSLQQEFPAIEQVCNRETDLPDLLTDEKGLHFGTIRNRGNDINVFLPTANIDELCLPRVVIGGMGTGKTKGFGGNLIVEAVKHGYTAIAIDPAKGELYEEAVAGLGKANVIRIQFGDKPILLDWCEAYHNKFAHSRLASNLISFVEANNDDAGPQTMRYLRSAAKAVPSGSLGEVLNLFTDFSYRDKLINKMISSERSIWTNFSSLSEARQNQIASPVLNRLDMISGDQYLNSCLYAHNKLDLVTLIDNNKKAIILDIPKELLGSEAVDILASFMFTKLDLAMCARKSTHPVFIIADEPHQYMRSSRIWKAACVESRKYRFSYNFLFHSWEQIPRSLAEILKASGPHYHIYRSSKETYRGLAEELRPWTVEEFLDIPRYYALNAIWANGVPCKAFLSHMDSPPTMKK